MSCIELLKSTDWTNPDEDDLYMNTGTEQIQIVCMSVWHKPSAANTFYTIWLICCIFSKVNNLQVKTCTWFGNIVVNHLELNYTLPVFDVFSYKATYNFQKSNHYTIFFLYQGYTAISLSVGWAGSRLVYLQKSCTLNSSYSFNLNHLILCINVN